MDLSLKSDEGDFPRKNFPDRMFANIVLFCDVGVQVFSSISFFSSLVSTGGVEGVVEDGGFRVGVEGKSGVEGALEEVESEESTDMRRCFSFITRSRVSALRRLEIGGGGRFAAGSVSMILEYISSVRRRCSVMAAGENSDDNCDDES